MESSERRVIPDHMAIGERVYERPIENTAAVGFAPGHFLFQKEKFQSAVLSNENENDEATQSICLLGDSLRRRRTGGRSEPIHGERSRVDRPWGYFIVIDQGLHYKIKKMVVDPGHRLSLQMHHHRNEYWLDVTGTARVTIGDEVFFLYPNQSTYIPMRTNHRLENTGEFPLEIIELQNGNCISEEDIIRFKDDYDRN